MDDGEELHVVIGGEHTEHVVITVLGRELPDADDYWDGNWLITPLTIRVGRFVVELPADLRADELRVFREGLESIYKHLDGESVLASLDGWITLSVRCGATGALAISGVVNDKPGLGNELRFSLDGLDQTYLPPIISALREVEARYPVRSQPGA